MGGGGVHFLTQTTYVLFEQALISCLVTDKRKFLTKYGFRKYSKLSETNKPVRKQFIA